MQYILLYHYADPVSFLPSTVFSILQGEQTYLLVFSTLSTVRSPLRLATELHIPTFLF